jgi:hypothetical protein
MKFFPEPRVICLWLGALSLLAPTAPAQTWAVEQQTFLADNLDRPLRYTPVGTDFVITNGGEFFNRPLYGGSSPFRVDAGDVPEFSIYLPGRGGNLRLGLRAKGETIWLHQAKTVVAIYRPGKMIYEIRDPLLLGATLRLEAIATRATEGFVLRAELLGDLPTAELLFAFGGVNGMRGGRDGDIGCEREPVTKFFQLRPEQCASNEFVLAKNSFAVRGKPGVVGGVFPSGTTLAISSATNWSDAEKLFAAPNAATLSSVLVGSVKLKAGATNYLGIQRLATATAADDALAVYREVAASPEAPKSAGKVSAWRAEELPEIFSTEDQQRRTLAERVVVMTPDPFVNAAAAALNIAADAVWDDRQDAYVHGGVAWRIRLLGWRVGYAGDELGWHERTEKHFSGYARQQSLEAIPDVLPAPEASANLARNETALHSNGDMTKSHYDMNLVGVDVFFRHLLWTGDLVYAKKMWPVIERHLAWERRLFRREFGADKLPLYEAYCCIWASDDLANNGGGATHSSAYNLFHNRMAARVARLIGEDPTPYEREAELILRGMKENLWLADRGWFAEWKDLIGAQLVHPNAAVWTFYHTVDSEVPTAQEAWQMSRFVDTQLARFPICGANVPPGNYTLPTTSWMPYQWSLNNVVLAETMHTALGYWQANRADGAFPLFKGALLDSMYLGLCPGNVGMCTWYDAVRRESQRDFGDGVGATSRTLVEGLFGVQPDLLAGEIKIHPGFPASWNDASIRHPDFSFSFHRDDRRETYTLENHFPKPVKMILQIAALREDIAGVTVNGQPAKWRSVEESVGSPRIEIETAAAAKQTVVVEWKGKVIDSQIKLNATRFTLGDDIAAHFSANSFSSLRDTQGALKGIVISKSGFAGKVAGTLGQRTVFAQRRQGVLSWWQPVTFEIVAPATKALPINWNKSVAGTLEMIDLTAQFNDSVTQIFRNEYRSPRSPFVSLAIPKQGIGSWCHPKDSFEVDDSGLRAEAAKAGGKIILPNGVPLATPGEVGAKNIAFVSQWDNYPREISVPLAGKSSHAFLLMAGSTSAMQSRFDNGEVLVTYADGSTARLALENPTVWWPIDQDYYIDDFAFARPEPLPVRVNLKTGKIRVLNMAEFKGRGGSVPGGAATVLDLPLDASKELKSLTVRAIANEVVIGLMSLTVQR